MSDLRVSLSMTFPDLDRPALAKHLAPVIAEALAAGGNFTSILVVPDDGEEFEDE